jgi:hypothetical protein
MTPKGQHIHWLYLWLAISAAGNIIGMASLVEGVVTWADFFKHIIELYRDNIRAPVAWVGNHLWPVELPGWVFDVFIEYGLIFISISVFSASQVRPYLVIMFKRYTDGDIHGKDNVILQIIFMPVLVFLLVSLILYFKYAFEFDVVPAASKIMSYVLFIIAAFGIILLINYLFVKLQTAH